MSDWTPKLAGGELALYQQLVGALERAVASGALKPGARLPPQRSLADQLNLSVGTVTKAYVEAERRGLTTGHVGRGTFIADTGPAASGEGVARDGPIDLGVNVIPHHGASRRLADSLNTLRRRADLLDLLVYAPAAGQDSHRRAAVTWIQRMTGYAADWSRLVITTGAQQAMALAFSSVCRAGDVILCEEATFYGMKSLAENAGYVLAGVTMDAEGLLPSALDKAARSRGAKALYVMPTVQNPTGRTMGRERRAEIVRIARKHDLFIVEDDNYALFDPDFGSPAPRLAELAPERTFYASGLSKCLAPGLRTGFLVCPSPEHVDTVLKTVRATTYAPASFGAAIFTQWLEDGSAFTIAEAHRREVTERCSLAQQALGRWLGTTLTPAPHVWLPMDELEAERVAGRALRLGAAVTPPTAPLVPGSTISGLRICIGAPATSQELASGLALLATAIAGETASPQLAFV